MPEIFDSEDHKKTETHEVEIDQASLEKDEAEKTPKTPKKPKKAKHREVDDYSEVMRQESPKRSAFSWYIPKPIDMSFSTQDIHENIVLVLRQHPVTQVGWLLISILLALLPMLIASSGIFDFLPDRFYFAGLIGWYLIITGFVYESILKWFYNVYIITDERIIDVDFHSLINRDISSAKIDNVEDVTASASGVLAAFFDYGNVVIQTAAEKREFEFPGVPHPSRVSTLINELILEEEQEKLEGRVR